MLTEAIEQKQDKKEIKKILERNLKTLEDTTLTSEELVKIHNYNVTLIKLLNE